MGIFSLLTGFGDPKSLSVKRESGSIAGLLWTGSNVFLRAALLLLVLQLLYFGINLAWTMSAWNLPFDSDYLDYLIIINGLLLSIALFGYNLQVLILTLLRGDYLWTLLVLFLGLSWLYKFLEGNKIKV